jgi:hypothetical protein
MTNAAPPDHPDPTYQLPADAYYYLIHTLNRSLPPPLTDNPEDLLRRNHSAIARIAALHPANAVEADIAATYVAASEHWKDRLRSIQQPDISPKWEMKCRAQAISMMRQAQSALRMLMRLQAVREKREADNQACDRGAWTEHCAIGLMMDALAPRSPPAETPDPPAPEPQPQPAPAPVPQPEPDPAAEAAPLAGAGLFSAAEQYAAIYPERAALIRRTGRVPDNIPFGPPDEDLVQALLTARTRAFTTLDRHFAEPRAP